MADNNRILSIDEFEEYGRTVSFDLKLFNQAYVTALALRTGKPASQLTEADFRSCFVIPTSANDDSDSSDDEIDFAPRPTGKPAATKPVAYLKPTDQADAEADQTILSLVKFGATAIQDDTTHLASKPDFVALPTAIFPPKIKAHIKNINAAFDEFISTINDADTNTDAILQAKADEMAGLLEQCAGLFSEMRTVKRCKEEHTKFIDEVSRQLKTFADKFYAWLLTKSKNAPQYVAMKTKFTWKV